MERRHSLFVTKLKLLLLLIVSMTLCKCEAHGSRINQAETLMSFRRSKHRAQVNNFVENWVNDLGFNDMKTNNNEKKMEDDYIQGGLPGQPSSKEMMMFKQYSGYINVDRINGRNLFYYFVEALNEPSSKPLVLWLNGGPGCSSLGVGAMLEIGPFGVNPDGKTLYSRRFSWNKVANILFLESPAGVGFSYSNTTSDYDLSGDKRTAEDSYVFLINWFRRFPHFKNNDFYIIGESYAGFYIPELADVITKKNVEGHSSSINFKGIMIGNGIMNTDTDDKGFNDYLWSHALISDETYRKLTQNCSNANTSDYCTSLEEELGEEIGNIDFYNIYGPTCMSLPDGVMVRNKGRHRRSSGLDPCEGEYVENYLNLPHVQKAFHANVTKLSYPWETCSKLIVKWKDSPSTMFPIYKRLISSGLQILLYSGDVDAVVPVSGTRYSIDAMNLKVIKPWRLWTDATKQVAGYKVVYDGLTFATVRGAGHEVPRFQPRQAFALLKMFLANRHYSQYDPLSKFLEVQSYKMMSANQDLIVDDFPVLIGSQPGLKKADKISSLPGQPKTSKFNHYSGYVTVDPYHGRALFYYLAESIHTPSKKPLVLWLNGGPGCSSIGGGMMMEHGPFRVNKDGKTLTENKYSWNGVANMLFLESPAGVGFSYSNTSSDLKTTGDTKTAKDSYTFLVNWLERFPEYKTRDFYITGESYAGHYIPQLAELILRSNKNGNQTVINLKGVAIGNAYIDIETQRKGRHDFLWSHSMVSDEIHDGIVTNCDFSSRSGLSDICKGYIDQEKSFVKSIYPYDIYAPLCLNGTSSESFGFDPCSLDHIESYLNIPQVQRALHANLTGLPGYWQDCNDNLFEHWHDQPFSMLPSIQRLMGSGIRFWLYSGDTDSSVPITTTEYAIKKLNTTIKTPWYPWYLKGEVGGYVVGYENLTFVTIRGAGHFVPSYQPARALALFSSFLLGKPLPSM
uniref:uncharacterized protein LOC122597474 n=1 Tax=Erigeron canadensis TaxID=72917 RepID=UPI001CB91B2D|nr:uncharacterized protein LOC122597474 [Erigeron canadensis]